MLACDYVWPLPDPDNADLVFRVWYAIEPYQRAVINADPSKCHPEEGGIIFDRMVLTGIDSASGSQTIRDLSDDEKENLISALALQLIDMTAVIEHCEEEARQEGD